MSQNLSAKSAAKPPKTAWIRTSHNTTRRSFRYGPVSAPRRTRLQAAAPAAPKASRGTWLTFGLGAVLVAGVLAAFVWFPARVENERAAVAPPRPPRRLPKAPARPILSPEEEAALAKQAEGCSPVF